MTEKVVKPFFTNRQAQELHTDIEEAIKKQTGLSLEYIIGILTCITLDLYKNANDDP